MSESHKGSKNPFFGRKHSPATKEKMSKKRKNIPKPEEVRAKIGRKGPLNWNWRGGISFEPYCPKFNKEFKERVRAFFGNVCPECGTPQSALPRKLCVHHVNYNKKACCDPKVRPLFIPLCTPCHSQTNHGDPVLEEYYTKMILEYYQGKCYFSKEEMEIYKSFFLILN